jgi:hypothetical protein
MKTLAAVSCVLLLGVVSLALWQLRPVRSAAPEVVAAAVASPVAPREAATPIAPAAPVASAPPPGVRPQIRQAIEAAAPSLRSAQDLQLYLDDAEARARRNHAITALEIEPALAAIRMQNDLDPPRRAELEGEFLQRMSRLANQLANN